MLRIRSSKKVTRILHPRFLATCLGSNGQAVAMKGRGWPRYVGAREGRRTKQGCVMVCINFRMPATHGGCVASIRGLKRWDKGSGLKDP